MKNSQATLIISRLIIIFAIFSLQACGHSGGPVVKHGGSTSRTAEVWRGPLLEECLNVSMTKRIRSYESRYHHSTETSLAIEIIQIGSRIEYESEGETDSTIKLRKEFSLALILQLLGLDGRERPFEHYCMRYEAPAEVVAEVVRKTLPVLGNNIRTDLADIGQYYTDFLEREHTTAKWRDAYVIDIEEIDSKTSAVRVYRSLEMLRGTDKWVHARSDGHNEAWLLQWVRTSL